MWFLQFVRRRTCLPRMQRRQEQPAIELLKNVAKVRVPLRADDLLLIPETLPYSFFLCDESLHWCDGGGFSTSWHFCYST